MKLVYFTKFEKGVPIDQMAAKANGAGLDGLDLAVRPEMAVHPDNVASALAGAVKLVESEGLSIPMVTAHTRLTDPGADETKRLFAACAEAGVQRVKLGYWVFRGEDPIEGAAGVRKALEGFAELAGQTGVTALFHTHSGPYYGLNAWGLHHVLDGFAPERIAAYLDPGHLTINGEPLELAFALHAGRLGAVALKEPQYLAEGTGGDRRVKTQIVPMGQGLADWPTVAQLIQDFAGPVSFHGEYHDVTPAERDRLLAAEVVYFKKLLADSA